MNLRKVSAAIAVRNAALEDLAARACEKAPHAEALVIACGAFRMTCPTIVSSVAGLGNTRWTCPRPLALKPWLATIWMIDPSYR